MVGERAAAAPTGTWRIDVVGEVNQPLSLTIDELPRWPQTTLNVDIHCVTRWSKLGVRFRGVLLADLLARAQPSAAARFVSFVAYSERDHSTSLPLNKALAYQALIALDADGEPLDAARGGPARVIVPSRYFYKSLKWLRRVELLAEDRLGYWEAVAGYHNEADPWLEQRYIATGHSRQQIHKLLASRDFSRQHLRSLRLAGHDLTGLNARDALIRDADFRDCQLTRACFDGANLSNAHLERASLADASFRGADVEGASFAGADLRGADFRGASLVAVTFAAPDADGRPLAAQIDARTRFDPAAHEALTPDQRAWLLEQQGFLPSRPTDQA